MIATGALALILVTGTIALIQARHLLHIGPITAPLTFDDEFTGTHVDRAKWNVADIGGPGYNNANLTWGEQRYTPSAVSVHDGTLSLLTSPVSANKTYRSGAVTTENKWTMQYGRLDVRAKLTSGNGLWPAIWLLPVGQANWASDYEIDLMEMLGKDPHTVYFTLHYAKATKQQQCQMTGPDFSAGYHTFTLLWRPGSAEWEVDGIVRCTITGEGVSTEPMYLLMNDAVGGAWPGEPDATTPLPQTMLVNYVRASALP